MSELADLLVLLHESDRRWRSLDSVVEVRSDLSRLAEAARARMGPTPGSEPAEAALVERQVSARYRVRMVRDPWRSRWDRLDHRGNDPAGTPPELVIDDGTVIWEQTAAQVSRNRLRSARSRALRTAAALLQPAGLGAAHHLAVTGTDTVEGRSVVLVTATPREAVAPAAVSLPELKGLTGRLAVDSDSGLLISARWSWQHEEVASSFFTELTVDPDLDPALFSFTPPPGAQVVDGIRIPTRYVPAIGLGIVTAAVGDKVARLFRRGSD